MQGVKGSRRTSIHPELNYGTGPSWIQLDSSGLTLISGCNQFHNPTSARLIFACVATNMNWTGLAEIQEVETEGRGGEGRGRGGTPVPQERTL